MKPSPAEWAAVLLDEREAYERCVELDQHSPETTPEKSDAACAYWSAVNRLLRAFVQSGAGGAPTVDPMPVECLLRLAGLAEHLGAGVVPTLASDVRRAGRPLYPRERKDIAWAIFYLEAVDKNVIDDPSPVRTVATAYGVARQSVQRWKKRRNEICANLEPRAQKSPCFIAREMKAAGERYDRLGRGATERIDE